MTQREKALAILFIRPGAEFVLHGLDIEWHDANKTQPTEEEIAQGWIDYQAKEAADKAEAEAKRQALLDKLGITEEEAKLLLS
jgi:hypothetical protein